MDMRLRRGSLAVLVTGAAFLAFVAAAGKPAGAATGSTPIAVMPTAPWTDTGLSVTSGHSLTITASGIIHFVDKHHWSGTPSGRIPCLKSRKMPAFSVPYAPCYSLVGRIGVDGYPFEIGTSFSTPSVSTSGVLYLGPNDNRFPDNRGRWVAVVTGATPSAPTVVSVTTPPTPATVPPATVPAVSTPSTRATTTGPLAFTGLGPELQALGIVGLVLVLVGLALFFFGRELRKAAHWLLGL